MTGNVLPDKVVTESNKTEKIQGGATISYLNAKTTLPPRGFLPKEKKEKSGPRAAAQVAVGKTPSPRASPRQSVSSTQSVTPEPKVRERMGGERGGREGGREGETAKAEERGGDRC